ncbi:NAD(P)-binding protein [Aspergillus tetrazonus]
MVTRKLRVGIAGLGRKGKRHAINFDELTARADVVAASTSDHNERQWAAKNLEGVQIFQDYDEMVEKANLEAVVVASVTAVHAEQARKAIKKGLHVLCEKPLSIDVEVAQSVVSAYEQSLKNYPQQKVMCNFSRRFDASYREAHGGVTKGEFGSPYAKTSGGIFVDCSIHDIDLMLWFLGENRKIKSLQAVGVCAVHPGLEASNDRDNAIATVEFEGGKIAALYCSRMMAAGQEDTTEIICEKGSVRVNMQVRKKHVEIQDSLGARRELPQHYYERFREAFITEANEFTACCLDDIPPPISLQSSVKAVSIGQALQRSLISGEKIYFDGASIKN